MQAGQIISNVPTANVSVSAFTEKVMLPNGKIKTVQIPAYNQTVPVNVPNGLEPLRLPDDFNQTIDNQFSFILQNNEGNYSLNFKGLSQEDLSDMQAHASIANETENVKQNTWYQVTASVDGNGSTTRLSYLNGTLIASVGSQNSGNQTVLLIGNNEDTAIALKNVTIQTQNQGTQQPSGTQKPTVNTANPNFTLYAAAAALAATATATVVYVRTKKSRQTKK
jgi:hypothetical protein